MLILRNNYAAYPAGRVHSLILPHESLLVYSSGESLMMLDARTLRLSRVLCFSEAFPGSIHVETVITHVAVDCGMKLIIATAGVRVAVWGLSKLQRGTWRIHSTLVLPDKHAITGLDIKSGLLAIGSQGFLSVYTLILENDLPTWSPKWTVPVITPSLMCFSPSLTYIVTSSQRDNVVRTYSTTSGRLVQNVPHPRPVINLTWRHTRTSSRDDLVLYTTTSDSTLRIFLPVLDSPHHLQLHASLDIYSSLPSSMLSQGASGTRSSIFWMEKDTISKAIEETLQKNSDPDDSRIRRLQDIIKEHWDLFMRIMEDGSVIVTAVANIDRRPPTLLRQFTLQQSLPGIFQAVPAHLFILPNSYNGTLTMITTSPISTFELHPLTFFDAHPDGLLSVAHELERVPMEEREIERFVRTLEGRGVGTLREGNLGEAWTVKQRGTALTRSGTWTSADFVVVLQEGRTFATYSSKDSIFTLHSTHVQTLSLPSLGYLFTMPSADGEEYIIGITDTLCIVRIRVDRSTGALLHTIATLPIDLHLNKILPVDPMAWGLGYSWAKHDVLLSISTSGELGFWAPEENSQSDWRCTGKVRTGRTDIKRARCSSAKKTAIIAHPGEDGSEELTIWDSFESEFASGLEYKTSYSEPINDLDWTSTLDNHSILAVGFLHRVELVCQQRMTYFDERPGWRVCWKIDISLVIPYPISDSVWLTHGSLLIGSGHHMLLYTEDDESERRASPQGALYDHVDEQNRPLRDYHPQLILQCLFWEKTELVKDIIVKLAQWIDARIDDHYDPWESLHAEDYWTKGKGHAESNMPRKGAYHAQLFGVSEDQEINSGGFSRQLVLRLLRNLESQPLPDLTPNENAHLLVLIQTTLEIEEQRRALDANGLRYLISLRSFSIFKDLSQSPQVVVSNGLNVQSGKRERIRYRDMIWAFHSESQGLLLQASISAHNGKMGWTEAKAIGLPIWLRSIEVLRTQMEEIARNQYMLGEYRDPTACSLFYFALGKVKLVHGLWRQASWHKEQGVMLKFLSNDFSEPRWRTAALKNAYALLGKRRFEYAAAFFLLGGAPKDAISVCIKQLGDFQLAIMLARVVEQSNEGPILLEVVSNTILPIAIQEGNRWLGSWAFWLLHRRDLAVRILLTPLRDIADILNINVKEIGESHYDDPSLALLFSQLKSKTLQAAKGTSEISSYTEFSFVLQMARVFCRLGCHVLALDLVRSWSFERPEAVFMRTQAVIPASPTSARPSTLILEPHVRRRASMVIDMDIPSLPPTRPASPVPGVNRVSANTEKLNEDGDLLVRKAGLGSLMKTAKMNVQVPEFDMNAFF
ncbi:hypothetical protein AX16_009737 [Volvariella volvacea WC 439]|nr:hypothetical protein AX16_009737 [Volvariella volvacea WC 439]